MTHILITHEFNTFIAKKVTIKEPTYIETICFLSHKRAVMKGINNIDTINKISIKKIILYLKLYLNKNITF